MIIHKTFRYKLNPTPAQEQTFVQCAGACRWLWNYMLAWRREAKAAGQKMPTWVEQCRHLTTLKRSEETLWLKEVFAHTLQATIKQLDKAYSAFFVALEQRKKGTSTRKVGLPKFKSKRGKQAFAFPDGVQVANGYVWLPKIGWVRYRNSRNIEGHIKAATVKREASGWYVCLACEVEIPEYGRVPLDKTNSVGIDLGLHSFLVSTQGHAIPAPKFYRKAQKRLARAQRTLARRKKGSKRRAQQKQQVARLHEKVTNQRRDFLHKLSTQLVRENQAVFAEDLNVQGLGRTWLAKSVHDVGWSMFVKMLDYKAKWQGKTFYQIGRFFPSSKTCYTCGTRNEIVLNDRVFVCYGCGTTVQRDCNAALNIQHQGLFESMPAE
jgi:putative transposase